MESNFSSLTSINMLNKTSLCSSFNTVKAIKSFTALWAVHAERVEKMRNSYLLVGKPKGQEHLRRPRRWWEDNIQVDATETVWGCGTGFNCLSIGSNGEICKHSNKCPGSIKGNFLISRRVTAF